MSKKYAYSDYRTFCNEKGEYGFIEVFYDKDDNILTYSDFKFPYGMNIRDLENNLELMAEALNEPTLYKGDLHGREKN